MGPQDIAGIPLRTASLFFELSELKYMGLFQTSAAFARHFARYHRVMSGSCKFHVMQSSAPKLFISSHALRKSIHQGECNAPCITMILSLPIAFSVGSP